MLAVIQFPLIVFLLTGSLAKDGSKQRIFKKGNSYCLDAHDSSGLCRRPLLPVGVMLVSWHIVVAVLIFLALLFMKCELYSVSPSLTALSEPLSNPSSRSQWHIQ